MPSNMFGAQARAAEYNAAKAATARQQASRDADEQSLPKPTAVPLGAFITPANRNKGVKTFRPLVLPEEECLDSEAYICAEGEKEHSTSPSPRSGALPRSASLPPQNRPYSSKVEALRSRLQTSFQYQDLSSTPAIPIAPRAMLQEEGYGFPPHHGMLPYAPHQLGGYQMYIPTPPAPTMPHHSYSGWYFPSQKRARNLYSPAELTPSSTYTPAPRAPTIPPATVPPFRPKLFHQQSTEPAMASRNPEVAPKTPSPSNKQERALLDGPHLYAFGPDDLSPTKYEIKEAYRAKLARESQELLIMQQLRADSMVSQNPVSTPNIHAEEGVVSQCQSTVRIKAEEDMIRGLQSRSEPSTLTRRKTSVSVMDLMIDSNSVAPPRPQSGAHMRRPSVLERFVTPSAPGRHRLESSLQSASRHSSKQDGVEATPTRSQSVVRHQSVTTDVDIRQMLLDAFTSSKQVESSSSPAQTSISEDSHQRRDEKEGSQDASSQRRDSGLGSSLEQECVTDIAFPLVDLNDSIPYDCRRIDPIVDKNWLQAISKLKRASVVDKWYEAEASRKDYADDELASLTRWTEVSRREHAKRQTRIEAVAAEMQQKWEHGGSFRAPTMTKADAAKHAATVKTIGNIMATLDIQKQDTTGFFHRGSRPYRPALESEIDKDAGKSGKPFSMFTTDNDSIGRTPSKLVASGAHRPQLGSATRLEDGRIPRMFVARRLG